MLEIEKLLNVTRCVFSHIYTVRFLFFFTRVSFNFGISGNCPNTKGTKPETICEDVEKDEFTAPTKHTK